MYTLRLEQLLVSVHPHLGPGIGVGPLDLAGELEPGIGVGLLQPSVQLLEVEGLLDGGVAGVVEVEGGVWLRRGYRSRTCWRRRGRSRTCG